MKNGMTNVHVLWLGIYKYSHAENAPCQLVCMSFLLFYSNLTLPPTTLYTGVVECYFNEFYFFRDIKIRHKFRKPAALTVHFRFHIHKQTTTSSLYCMA